jgi:hypothetical protein
LILDNDTSSQDTSDQQEASDKQKPIDVEKTKQKLADIDKQQTLLSVGLSESILQPTRLMRDTSSQDTSDQQEASDKQKPIDVEKTKQQTSTNITYIIALA